MAVRKDGHFLCLHNSFGLKILTLINLLKIQPSKQQITES